MGAGLVAFGLELDKKCSIIGLIWGYFLGPVLETLVLLHQLWALQLRSRCRSYTGARGAKSLNERAELSDCRWELLGRVEEVQSVQGLEGSQVSSIPAPSRSNSNAGWQ